MTRFKYSLLFAALLSVYAQADVSVSDDPSLSKAACTFKNRSAGCFWGCTRLADMLPSEYEDNTLQIKEKSTERTAPFFVLEVTARSAADILGIYPNSAVLFYHKIRMVISHYLALAADEVFEGSVELDES